MGVQISVDLAQRKARGAYRAAQAERRAVDARLRAQRDAIQAEVRRARADLDAAAQKVALARSQVEVAQQLAEAERERFRNGASDLVVVNLRETAAAEAARFEVEARAAHQIAWAAYRTARGDRAI